VQSSTAFGVNDIEVTINLCVELQEKQVTVESCLKNVRGLSWIFPKRDIKYVVTPEPWSLWRAFVVNLNPFAEDSGEISRLAPLRQLRLLVVEEKPAL
jgi:hypothetical protein